MVDEKLNRLIKEVAEELFGKPVKATRSSTRDSRQKTGRYWVYDGHTDAPIAKLCETCRHDKDLMKERFEVPLNDDYYVTNRRNHDKCDICGNV